MVELWDRLRDKLEVFVFEGWRLWSGWSVVDWGSVLGEGLIVVGLWGWWWWEVRGKEWV